jgi:hypothetical protein
MGKLLLWKSMDAFCRRKRGQHAWDNIWACLNFMAAGIGQWLHDGWSHSHPPGHRHRCGAGPSYSGTKTLVAVLTLAGEGEVLGKEVVSRPRKILSNLRTLQ